MAAAHTHTHVRKDLLSFLSWEQQTTVLSPQAVDVKHYVTRLLIRWSTKRRLFIKHLMGLHMFKCNLLQAACDWTMKYAGMEIRASSNRCLLFPWWLHPSVAPQWWTCAHGAWNMDVPLNIHGSCAMWQKVEDINPGITVPLLSVVRPAYCPVTATHQSVTSSTITPVVLLVSRPHSGTTCM